MWRWMYSPTHPLSYAAMGGLIVIGYYLAVWTRRKK